MLTWQQRRAGLLSATESKNTSEKVMSPSELSENDTSESVANKIHELEYEFFPKVIEEILDK